MEDAQKLENESGCSAQCEKKIMQAVAYQQSYSYSRYIWYFLMFLLFLFVLSIVFSLFDTHDYWNHHHHHPHRHGWTRVVYRTPPAASV